VSPGPLLFAAVLSLILVPVSAAKLWLLIEAGGGTVTYRGVVAYYYIGHFFNAFLPTSFGGDVAKSYYLHRDTAMGVDAVAAVVWDRFTGLLAVTILTLVASAVGLIVAPNDVFLGTAAVATALLVPAGLLVLRHDAVPSPERWLPDLPRLLQGIADRLGEFVEHAGDPAYRGVLPGAVGIALGYRLLLVAINLVVARGLGIDVAVVYFLVVVPVAELVMFLPISIQGFGVREITYATLFGLVGVATGPAVALALLMQLVLRLLHNLIGGGVYVTYLLTREPTRGDAA
jgi:hypothetical protein